MTPLYIVILGMLSSYKDQPHRKKESETCIFLDDLVFFPYCQHLHSPWLYCALLGYAMGGLAENTSGVVTWLCVCSRRGNRTWITLLCFPIYFNRHRVCHSTSTMLFCLPPLYAHLSSVLFFPAADGLLMCCVTYAIQAEPSQACNATVLSIINSLGVIAAVGQIHYKPMMYLTNNCGSHPLISCPWHMGTRKQTTSIGPLSNFFAHHV